MNRVLPCLAALLLAGTTAQAAPPSAAAKAPAPVAVASRTGDAWLDARLPDIDLYAARYPDAFVDEVVRYGRAPRELVQALLARPGWSPSDAYLACALAVQAARPCREVADRLDPNAPHPWSTVATDLGVAPGTPAFHALKRALVASYDRWARPVAVDDDLARDFPTRPRMAPPKARDPAPPAR